MELYKACIILFEIYKMEKGGWIKPQIKCVYQWPFWNIFHYFKVKINVLQGILWPLGFATT